MKMETKALYGLETKFAASSDEQTGLMSGYGAVFGNQDCYGDIIKPGAFKASLAAHKNAGTTPLMLLNHDMRALPIGIWDSMVEDDDGLLVSGHFIDNLAGADAYKTAKAGAITGLSIGYFVTDFEMRDGCRVITGIDLLEVSLVTLPANDLARVTSIKSQENDMTDDHEEPAERLAMLIAEAKSLIAQLETKSEDDADCECDEDDEECDCEDQNSAEGPQESKYREAALAAINDTRGALLRLLQ